MNKLKKSYPARCIAVFLAVLSGVAAAAGALIIVFTLDMRLYQTPLNAVISDQAHNMQVWYSAKVFSKMEEISLKSSKDHSIAKNIPTIQTELAEYLHTDNFEFGVIHADTLDKIDLVAKNSYIYQNFTTTKPEHDSIQIPFVEDRSFSPGTTPKLLESLVSWYEPVSFYNDQFSIHNQLLYDEESEVFYYDEEEIKPNSVYWIVSTVKDPIDESSDDIFTQQKELLTFLYHFRFTGFLLTIFLAILFLLCTIFCGYSASSTSGGKSPVTWRHKTPLLFNICFDLGVTGSCCTFVCILLETLLTGDISIRLAAILCIPLTALGILFIILLLMNLCVRQQEGILWKYTLTRILSSPVHKALGHIRQIFHRILRTCTDHTSLLFRSSVIMIIISFLELLGILSLENNEGIFMLWLLFKLIELPLVFALLIQMQRLQDGSRRMAGGNLESKIDTKHMFWEFRKHGEYLNQIRDGMSIALEERLKSERFKTELITNVSHDIKTPLTSLINYVDLLQKKDITENDRKEYLSILERQSARLKKLIEDLIEASKVSTGNVVVNMESCDIQILLTQTIGEFEEKLHASQLELLIQKPDDPVTIQADNRHLWRIFDNLMNNICKYTLPGTRVYIDLKTENNAVSIIFKNISRYALNFSGDELLERFVRGDISRNTEGNGLGLSIARSLAESMNGTLDIITDGDLFKAVVSFPLH